MDLKDIRLYVDDRPAEGVFRMHRDVYADPQLFELEQKYIFERTWNFPGGMATPDDTIVYSECQSGLAARPISFLLQNDAIPTMLDIYV